MIIMDANDYPYAQGDQSDRESEGDESDDGLDITDVLDAAEGEPSPWLAREFDNDNNSDPPPNTNDENDAEGPFEVMQDGELLVNEGVVCDTICRTAITTEALVDGAMDITLTFTDFDYKNYHEITLVAEDTLREEWMGRIKETFTATAESVKKTCESQRRRRQSCCGKRILEKVCHQWISWVILFLDWDTIKVL